RLLNGTERVGLSAVVVSGFVRIITNRSALANPLMPTVAVDVVKEWFEHPHVVPVNPGPLHLGLFRQNLEAAGVGGNLVTDAHIAAIAMEHQAEVHSNDSDFARFPGLRWRNPIRAP
ncbi:MAG: type II toxin-antitoxin system VapC family toxin, partial [Chloroflexi bacterium]|nr:type II toxin-antitoxin system VapC family toxin [Chloroflexota bacterium]